MCVGLFAYLLPAVLSRCSILLRIGLKSLTIQPSFSRGQTFAWRIFLNDFQECLPNHQVPIIRSSILGKNTTARNKRKGGCGVSVSTIFDITSMFVVCWDDVLQCPRIFRCNAVNQQIFPNVGPAKSISKSLMFRVWIAKLEGIPTIFRHAQKNNIRHNIG